MHGIVTIEKDRVSEIREIVRDLKRSGWLVSTEESGGVVEIHYFR